MPTDDRFPLSVHLAELRRRLLVCLGTVGALAALSYPFSHQIFLLLARPLRQALPPGGTLIFIAPTEPFLTYIKLSAFSGLFLGAPVVLWQIWRFVTPGLYEHERRHLLPFLMSASALFVLGVSFAYFVVFPLCFRFLLRWGYPEVQPLPSMGRYLDFTAKLLLAMGAAFELPVFIFFLAKLGLVDAQQLSRWRRYAVVLIFAGAAILTPPDVISQLLMAGPLLALYEVSVLVARAFGRQRGKR